MSSTGKGSEKADRKSAESSILALKRRLLEKAELSIWLDSYDDIFSDFDSRSYADRALSDDFINEVHKMAKEKSTGKIELKLLMPASIRKHETEEAILKSLHAHFRLFAQQNKTEMNKIWKKGILLTLIGVIILTLSAYLVNIPFNTFFINILRIMLEPFGLFLVWTGMESLFYRVARKRPLYEFHQKMAHAEIKFLSI